MNAIIPLNVAAIRVNQNDATNIVNGFKGATAVFNQLPWKAGSKQPSTGNTIYQPFESKAGPPNPLHTGVHVHWELPDYFRRGVQVAGESQPGGAGRVRFPHTPNRWIVIRYFSSYDAGNKQWASPTPKAFLIESDYLSQSLPDSVRPAVSVPLPSNPPSGAQPFLYMGRVLDYSQWNPASENPQDYLPAYTGAQGEALYLTSIGFVGPGFASYYPECCSVFGFWDNFSDMPAVAQAIASNTPIQFRVSYQVIGWINETASDPLHGLTERVTNEYNDYVAQQHRLKLPVTETPADVFASVARSISSSWVFEPKDIRFTLKRDDTIDTLTVPTGTLCCGTIQEVVWNMLTNTGSTYFLANPDAKPGPSGTWTDQVTLAVGNSTAEALSALLKKDFGNGNNDPDVLKNYEYLLDALQLGLLRGLEGQDNKIILLDEALHSRAFSGIAAGQLWSIRAKQSEKKEEADLPLDLAEKLFLLNQAQNKYDQARAALDTMRKQLFMDWFRFINLRVPDVNEPYLTWSQIQNFVATPKGGELNAVIKASEDAGILTYNVDAKTGKIVGINAPPAGTSSANAVYDRYREVVTALANLANFELVCSPAPAFNLPADPVLVVEGDRIEPVRRNGATGKVAVRLSNEVLSTLAIEYNGARFTIPVSTLKGVPTATAVTPMQPDVQAVIAEAYLLTPSLASVAADALAAQGGNHNPAVANYAGFVSSLELAEGGLSPLEGAAGTGLYNAIRQPGYKREKNPVQAVASPPAISVTFTNSDSIGWAPDPVAWNAQANLPGFPQSRVDPFMPVFVMWSVRLRPLNWKDAQPWLMNYSPDNVVSYFQLDSEAVDYRYLMTDSTPVNFTSPNPADYSGSIVLSKKPVFSLTAQIDDYIKNFPSDPINKTLEAIKDKYIGRRILSQALSGMTPQQVLRNYIPQITVVDLVLDARREPVTSAIHGAAGAVQNDNWYTWAFNSVSPISSSLLAQTNFGPLRSGFFEMRSLTIVDVYGQIMQLTTAALTPDGALQSVPSINLQPRKGDTVNKDWMYFPPRLLAPTRLWFRWLSATHNNAVSSVTSDFVEMNDHPATSPICGWILPNHLDNSLFFYRPDGAPVGSFGIEADLLKYRTRAGNRDNRDNSLSRDIGPRDAPTVNPHLAAFMWYIDDHKPPPGFLRALITTIQDSDAFINPANYAQNATLAVLLGRPLAITRCILSAETAGGLLPLNQADLDRSSPFPQDVLKGRTDYAARQATSSGNLDSVQFPVRLGDLENMDDGMVGFLIESGSAEKPYSTFYSPAAPSNVDKDVKRPEPGTISLTLNAKKPIVLTLLVDPRAGVHATTGILPVEELSIPTTQYAESISSLAMTFFTNPVLSERQGLVVPLPTESNYDWFWINADDSAPIPLQPDQGNEFAVYDYTPQTVLEGWLQLKAAPPKTRSEE